MATEILSSLSSESVEKIVVGKFTLTKKKKTGNNSSSLLQNSTTPNNNGENLIRKGASVIRQDEILKKSKQQSKQDTTKTDIKLDHISYKFKKLQIQRKDAVNRHLHGDPQPASSEQTARFKKGHRINQDEKYYKKPRNIARQSAAQSSSSNLNPKDELPPPETTVTNPLVRITLRGYYKVP